MSTDFINELGRKLSETAEEVTKKTSEVVEKQRLRNQVYTLQRGIQNQYQEMGKAIYQKFLNEEELEEDFTGICEEIHDKSQIIKRYEKEIAKINGCVICENCGTSVNPKDIFCKRCGEQIEE